MRSKGPLVLELSESIRSEEILALRRRLRLTQRDFATVFGVSSKTVERWEAENKPVTGPIVTLARVLWEYPQIVDRLIIPPQTMPYRFWYCYRGYHCTLIDVDDKSRQIEVRDYTLERNKKAFSVISAPTYADFEELLAYRCGIAGLDGEQLRKTLLSYGLTRFDPLVILRETQGRLPNDEFSLTLESTLVADS